MKAEKRREEIVSLFSNSQNPISASMLSQRFQVSRQVIVNDIAVIRSQGYEIIATARGYMISTPPKVERVFKCRHSFEEMLSEGDLVFSQGGTIEDIFVQHRIYGRLCARLDLKSRMHVEELYRSLKSGASKPLMSVTDGYHYHTVSADSEEKLDEIETLLRQKGYLIEI